VRPFFKDDDFTEEEGADSHCEPAAKGIRGERIFDWLDQHIPA
jgi:hypothetical protein